MLHLIQCVHLLCILNVTSVILDQTEEMCYEKSVGCFFYLQSIMSLYMHLTLYSKIIHILLIGLL